MKWLELILQALPEFKGKTTLVILATVIGGCYYLKTEVVEPLQDWSYNMVTYDYYRGVEFDLLLYKENKSKSVAISSVTLARLDYYCNTYFGINYTQNLPQERKRRTTVVCDEVSKEYIDRLNTPNL